MDLRTRNLWTNSNFLRFWAGQSISQVGSQITVIAIPLLAALHLQATPAQMGMLGIVQYAPYLLVGLFAGVFVDRVKKRLLLIITDLGRAVLLGLIPLLAFLGRLRFEHLYLIGFFTGILNLFFEVAYASYLPNLLKPQELTDGNSKLQTSASIAEIVGPGLGGWLSQAIGASLAILGDSFSFLVSAFSLALVRATEPVPASGADRRKVLEELRDGLRLVLREPNLRAFAGCSGTANIFININLAVYVLYLTRELGLEGGMVGLFYAFGSLGSLIGALFAMRLVQWFGFGRTILGETIVVGLAATAIPFIHGSLTWIVPMFCITHLIWSGYATVYIVNAASLRQTISPAGMLGRVTASTRFISWGAGSLGFLIGGWLGGWIGLRPTLIVAGLGLLLSSMWMLPSPLRSQREMPTQAQLPLDSGGTPGAAEQAFGIVD